MFEDQENLDKPPVRVDIRTPTAASVNSKPNGSEIVQIRVNTFNSNSRVPVPQHSAPSCSTFIDSG